MNAVMATTSAAAATANTDWWGGISNSFGNMGAKIFESIGEGSNLYVQGKVAEKLGYNPAQQQAYLDATNSAAYQRQQVTGVGRDWDGATLNDDVVTIGGMTIETGSIKTGALLIGGALLAVLAFKVLK